MIDFYFFLLERTNENKLLFKTIPGNKNCMKNIS